MQSSRSSCGAVVRAAALGCATLLTLLLALGPRAEAQDAQPADAAAPSAQPAASAGGEAEAMERFADAQAMFERGDHRGALAEMQRVYDLLEGSPTQYVLLYNISRVYEELHRYDLAVTHLQRFLAAAPPDAPDRADAAASLRALERLLGVVVLRVNVPHAQVWIGEWQVGEAPGEIRVPSGINVLEVRAAGYESARRELSVTARSRVELTLTLAALSDFRGLDRRIFITSTVAAGVAALAGAALGGAALALHDDAAQCATTAGCKLEVPARRQTIADLALAADISFAAAGVFAVTSVVLGLLTDWGHHAARAAASDATALRVAPLLGARGARLGETLGLAVSGAF